MEINGTSLDLQFDSGADVTIVTEGSWAAIGRPKLRSCERIPVDAQGNNMPIMGICSVDVRIGTVLRSCDCLVAKTGYDLFGIDWIDAFGLWNKSITSFCNQIQQPIPIESFLTSLQSEHSSVFAPGLGTCNAFQAQLHLIPGQPPVYRPKRPVPYHVMDKVEAELERLEQAGIITPVQYSNYAAPIVVVKKANGSIRICGDYSTGLNKSLESHQYPVPTPEKIFASLSNCSIFTQLDLSDAYLQIQMDEESRRLLTITTHKGLFAFNRLCPGVKPAAGIFQQAMDTMLAGIPNVICFFDDVLIATSTIHQHQVVLLQVFERLRQFGMRVRMEKCNFFKEQVRYLGIIVDRTGQRPDPEKTAAITRMPEPSNVSELRSFLGAVTFYGRFVRDMSTIRAPLDKLLRKDVPFRWNAECTAAFKKFKEILTSELLLTHYDPELPITVAADASSTGIGAVAYHTYPDGSVKAFAHVSRRLLPAEMKYAQIEKEALALTFGILKYHQYIYGRRFSLRTDHRPLLSIFGSQKGIPAHSANRLQRWAIIMLGYDFDIDYINTNDFGHADVLSRLISNQPRTDDDIVIACIRGDRQYREEHDLNVPVNFTAISQATVKDRILSKVCDYVINGWPSRQSMEQDVIKYYNLRESLSTNGDCLLYLDRTVIPSIHRKRVLTHLHNSHPGITRMKALARCFVYWPGIDGDISTLVNECSACQDAAKAPRKTSLASWPIPSGPWQRIHADFAGPINNKMFLILVDAYSKWPEIIKMSSTTAADTILKLKEVCSRMGNMATLVTDNGPQFDNALITRFCKEENIQHIRTPPYHPQSNGLAERFVDSFKRMVIKSKSSGDETIFDYLRSYRSTPNENTPTGQSPAEIIFGRRLNIPLTGVLPPTAEGEPQRNIEMEDAFNRHHGAKDKEFNVGEEVSVRLHKKAQWCSAVILERLGRVVYIVLMGERVVKTHANQMRRTSATAASPTSTLDPSIIYDTPTVAEPSSNRNSPVKKRRPRLNWRKIMASEVPAVLRPRPN